MLDIWTELDEGFASAFLKFQQDSTGEILSPNSRFFVSSICPYDGYAFIRIEIQPQLIIRGEGQNYTLSAKSLSYVLVKIVDNYIIEILPLVRNADFLYSVNRMVDLKLTDQNVIDYVTVMGLILNDTSFYFISNIHQIKTILQDSTNAAEAQLLQKIESIYKIKSDGSIAIRLKTKSYPILGKCFTLNMPCIFNGGVFYAELRIAENGLPTMDQDKAFNIEGIMDRDAYLKYYELDFPHEMAIRHSNYIRTRVRFVNFFGFTFIVERYGSILLTPIFLFNMFVIFCFGQDRSEIKSFFDLLQSSSAISWSSMIIGVLLTTVFTMRFFVFSLSDYAQSLVPNVFGQFTYQIKQHSKSAALKLGVLSFMIVTVLEFGISFLVSLTIFSYGLFNNFNIFSNSLRINFWQSFLVVIYSIPVAGKILIKFIGSKINIELISVNLNSPLYFSMMGFLFSTVFVGLMYKTFSYTKKEDSGIT